jgi:DNA-binding transcriptional MerR regulator
MKHDGRLSIGELGKAAGVKVVTVRYYEQVKLMPAPPRTAGNYRAYKLEDLRRLQFIRRCRDLGFTLDQVRELLRLSTRVVQECSQVNRIAANHLNEIERKIADLKRLAAELRRINDRCSGNVPMTDCRILDAPSPVSKRPDLLGV